MPSLRRSTIYLGRRSGRPRERRLVGCGCTALGWVLAGSGCHRSFAPSSKHRDFRADLPQGGKGTRGRRPWQTERACRLPVNTVVKLGLMLAIIGCAGLPGLLIDRSSVETELPPDASWLDRSTQARGRAAWDSRKALLIVPIGLLIALAGFIGGFLLNLAS